MIEAYIPFAVAALRLAFIIGHRIGMRDAEEIWKPIWDEAMRKKYGWTKVKEGSEKP